MIIPSGIFVLHRTVLLRSRSACPHLMVRRHADLQTVAAGLQVQKPGYWAQEAGRSRSQACAASRICASRLPVQLPGWCNCWPVLELPLLLALEPALLHQDTVMRQFHNMQYELDH